MSRKYISFRRYSFPGRTCGFRSFPFSAGTSARTVHALPGSSRFPQVLPLGLYMRFLLFFAFRMYSRSDCTCVFRSSPLSAGTLARVVHAVSASPRFPHVLLLDLYVWFRLFTAFRRYSCPRRTCGFRSSPLCRSRFIQFPAFHSQILYCIHV